MSLFGWWRRRRERKRGERLLREYAAKRKDQIVKEWGEPTEAFDLLQLEAQDVHAGDYTRMVDQRGKNARWQFFEDVTVLGDEVRCSMVRPDRTTGMTIYAYGQHVEVARPAEAHRWPMWGVLSDWLTENVGGR